MIERILIIDVVLAFLLLVLALILVRSRNSRRYSSDVKELERRLNEAVEENQELRELNEDEYVGSPNNKKYHKKDCRFVELLKEKEFGTLEEFKKKKYSPCGTCLKK